MRKNDGVYVGPVSEVIYGFLAGFLNSRTLAEKFYRHQRGWLAAIGAFYLFLTVMVIGKMPSNGDSGLTLAILVFLAAIFAIMAILALVEIYLIHKNRS